MEVKKSEIIFLALLILLCGVSIYSYMTYSYNEELQKTINKKDKILGDLLLKDSVRNDAQKKYSKNIEKYVEDCSYIVDGKEVNSQGILKIIDKLYNENYQKTDSLRFYLEKEKIYLEREKLYQQKVKNDEIKLNFFLKNYPKIRDSLDITKSVIKEIERNYSTRVSARIEGDKMILSTPINKLDSALAVYKYYKHKLKVENNRFTVEIDPDNPNAKKSKK